jgi:soluble lytic murein transglycosylase-like protein
MGGAALGLDGELITRFATRLCPRIDSPITMLGAVAFAIAATLFGGPTLATEVPSAHSNARSSDPIGFGGFILEASVRFSISQIWIRAVMQQESGGIVRIVSPKGAIGLMQVMPETYFELARRYGLGPDPFNPRDNILAGTAYLREMQDRFGSPGFLAAYNAGPRRYEQHLWTGRPLPNETIAYMASVTQSIHGPRSAAVKIAENLSRAASAPLFVLQSQNRSAVDLTALTPQANRLTADRSAAKTPRGGGLFAVHSLVRDFQ